MYWTLLQRHWILSQNWKSDSCHQAAPFICLFIFAVARWESSGKCLQRCRGGESCRVWGLTAETLVCKTVGEAGGFLAGHRTEVGRCQWVKWRLLQNTISEGEISEVAGNTTEFYGSASSFNFLSIPSHDFLTAILLLPFPFSLHSLLLQFFNLCVLILAKCFSSLV